MSAAVLENVMSLLASIGFDAGQQPGTPCEIMIDTFDQWSHADNASAMVCSNCGLLIAQ